MSQMKELKDMLSFFEKNMRGPRWSSVAPKNPMGDRVCASSCQAACECHLQYSGGEDRCQSSCEYGGKENGS